MAGTPTSPFLANVYLKAVDKYFHDAHVTYARYSDDIIIFAPDRETLEEHQRRMADFLKEYQLEINPDKERIYAPDEAYEFLGFKCHGHDIDISEATKRKMKGKIRRATKRLMRWSNKKNIPCVLREQRYGIADMVKVVLSCHQQNRRTEGD